MCETACAPSSSTSAPWRCAISIISRAGVTVPRAFETWGKFVWQEFDLGGRRVGAPQFIVNVSQSPDFRGPWFQREFLSIWNQAWFSSLRSASGLFRYARRAGDKNLLGKALLTKELALSAPLRDGLFPSVIRTDNVEVEAGRIGADQQIFVSGFDNLHHKVSLS